MMKRIVATQFDIDSISKLFVCIILLFCFCGCADRSDDSSANTELGDIAFKIVLQKRSVQNTDGVSFSYMAKADAGDDGIDHIRVRVYDGETLLKEGGPWSWSAGSGTIEGIQPGTGRDVVVLVNDADQHVLYRGEASGIDITAGQTSNAGAIECNSFIPRPSSPSNDATVYTDLFESRWAAITGAGSYGLVISENEDLSSPVIDIETAEVSYQPTGLAPSTTYYWCISALDKHGHPSAGSDIQRFTTQALSSVSQVTDFAINFGIDPKMLEFAWEIEQSGAIDHFRLDVDPDGASGFVAINEASNIKATEYTLSIPVHLTDWENALYRVVALDSGNNELDTSEELSLSGRVNSEQVIGYLKASNTGAGDLFGYQVVLSSDGGTLAVGALDEASAATDIGGTQDDNSAAEAGAVYVYTRDSSGVWSQQSYVKASNTGVGDYFGGRVALSSDGSTLAVGAPVEASAATGIDGNQADNSTSYAGAVYVYTRGSSGVWSQQSYVKASNTGADDRFGGSVSLSSDGSTLAVGALGEASAAVGVGGTQNDNSAAEAGAVYVYTRDSSGVWSQQSYVKASNTGADDRFGGSVSLSSDGSTLAVGAGGEASTATDIGGTQADNSAADAGAVYVYTRDSSGVWSQQAYVKASNTGADDRFGGSVSLSSNGNTLAVGAQYEDSAATGIGGTQADNSAAEAGAVYVYTRDSSDTWAQQAYVKASNTDADDFFGHRVALSSDGNTLAISAWGEFSTATGIGGNQADNGAENAGAVYVYTRDSTGVWTHHAYVKAGNTGGEDHFGAGGMALSLDGSTLAVGAWGEDSAATGIGGNQADNSAENAGAVYLY